eukprot:6206925-Pleurochrysis_carterae.AAC.1
MERFVIPKGSSSEGLCLISTWLFAALGVNIASSGVVDGCGVLALTSLVLGASSVLMQRVGSCGSCGIAGFIL